MIALDLSDVRVLEDMVIDCIYNNLFSARMDNKQQQLIVDYVSSRDFKAEDMEGLFIKLRKWYEHIEIVEKIIEDNLNKTIAGLKENEMRKKEVNKKVNQAYESASEEILSQQRGRRDEKSLLRPNLNITND